MTPISSKTKSDNHYQNGNTPTNTRDRDLSNQRAGRFSKLKNRLLGSIEQSNRSLYERLLWVVLPTALLPLMLGSFAAYKTVQATAEERIEKQLRDRALLSGKVTGDLLANGLELPTILASNPSIINAVREASKIVEEKQLQQALPERVEKEFERDKLILVDKDLNNYLNKIARTTGVAELFFTERYGYNVSYSNPTSDILQSDELWWQKGKEKKQWISSPDFDQSSGTFSVDLVQAISDPQTGEFLGIIKSVLPSGEFSRLAQYIENTGIGASQQLQIIDAPTGEVITTINAEGTSDTKKIIGGQKLEEIAKSVVQKLADPGLDPKQTSKELQGKYQLQEVSIEPFSYENGEQALTVSLADEDKRYILATVPKTDGWLTIASIDDGEIIAAGSELIGVFLAIAVVLGAGAAILVSRLARQLSEPLDSLAGTAEQVASGNLEVTAEPRGTRETQTLALSFNNLISQIKNLLEKQALEARQAVVMARLSRSQNIEEIEDPLNQILEEIRKSLLADRTLVYKFDENWQGQIVAEAVNLGWPQSMGAKIKDPCFAEQYVEKYRQGRIQAVEDIYAAGLSECHINQLEAFAVKANLVVPILIGDKLFGLLVAHQCSGTRVWSRTEIDYLAQFALRIGSALSTYGLLEQKQAEAEREKQRNEILQRELFQLLADVEEASQGDLTVRAEISASEIGIVADFFNAIIESLRDIVIQVKEGATEVNNSVGENETAIRYLSKEALKQANQITQTLNSVEQMTLSIQEVANKAKSAAEVARQASLTAQTSGGAMEQTVDTILGMQRTISETARKVKRLGDSSQQISKVISLINQISLKTKVLAVNAGIEAGRAGEEAQGFAVVAEEVGKLAAQSAAATKEVEQIIEKIQLETVEVVEAMELGKAQVSEGTRLIEKTKEGLGHIVEVSSQIDRLVQSISNTTVSQVHSSKAVTELMQKIAEISQQTSDSSMQVSIALKQTVEIAKQLQASVSTFKVETQT